MDFVRQQLVLIQERLAGLSPSQKMLTAALVVIMVMTLLYWGRFASGRDLVAVLPGALGTPESLAAATGALTSRGIAFDVSDGTLRVAADKQNDALAAISLSDAMPANAANAFDAMLDKMGPLDTQGQFNMRLKSAREARLAQVIMRYPDVRSAIVVITDGERGGLTRAEPRLSVDIMTKNGANKSQVAKAAASFVVNAVSGLDREHITVNVDMTPIISGGNVMGDVGGSNSALELRAKVQAEKEAGIRAFYFNIPNLFVSVTAEVDAKSVQEKTIKVDPKNAVSMTKQTTSENSQTVDPPRDEPGVMSNVPQSANGPTPGAVGGSKTERLDETNEVVIGRTESETSTPAGATKFVSVSLRVPRSHFLAAWRGMNRKTEPTDDQLDAFMQREMKQMRLEMQRQANISDETMVTVADYFDFDATNDPSNPVAIASATGGLTLLATGHAKEVSIGALALTSLFMVSRMVKRSAPPAPEPMLTLDDMPNISSVGGPKKGAKGSKTLDGGFDMAGDVMEGGPIMMGRELDEEVLETSQMVEQVSGFVKDHPDAAAQLIKRWMNHG